MQTIIVTPKNDGATTFLKQILEDMKSVQSVKIIDENKEIPFVKLSEISLMKEWGSKEDDIYNDWAKKQLNNQNK